MKALLGLAAVLLLAVSLAAPAAAQHARYTHKQQLHNSAASNKNDDSADDQDDTGDSDDASDATTARDREDYAEGYRDSERRRYIYRPVKRRVDHRYSPYRYRATMRYDYPHGYSGGSWDVGGNLPEGYYSPSSYVDYRYYRLSPPPEGYQWVRIDKDVYLVSEGTGFIREVLYELFY
jgi:Ni/Co efflux regulator RcnB